MVRFVLGTGRSDICGCTDFVLPAKDTFLDGTVVNGIDVSGMTRNQAQNIISYSLLSTRSDIKLTLTYNDKRWEFYGNDFEIKNEVEPVLTQILKTDGKEICLKG